ncbi:MAG: LPS-assembly protein LptD, partial [Comamonadaceae bacterium]|nr:LPS-assembly protein LptD [Comamonadaceae bacterium]
LAEGAVLRFLGTPILALPTMSFALGDARKSGWLPPSVNLDNRSGVELLVPYYWNIAPNRDATIAPRLLTRRGLGLDLEYRYLEPDYAGEAQLGALPNDRVAGRARGVLQWTHEGRLPWGLRAGADVARVSDNDWWRDFPNRNRSLTPRLLPTRAALERPLGTADADGGTAGGGDVDEGYAGLAYLRTTRWQVLQALDAPVVAPYERALQLGARLGGRAAAVQWSLLGEFNRFVLPSGLVAPDPRSDGDRVHLLASASLPWRGPATWFVPRLSLNAAAYRWTDTATLVPQRAERVIPSVGVDAGLVLERGTQIFGRRLRQTLEPRLLYVNTPFRAQSGLPVYDTAGKDFNFTSIYSDNAFAGVDRVSDAHQLTAGVTTRLVDADSGAEALRLGIAQRYLLRGQQVTAQADGTPDGPPLTQRWSDLLLLAATNLLRAWSLEGRAQYNPDSARIVRSIVGVRYAPGPYRTVGATYRFTRGLAEQLEVGWQWPLLERALAARGAAAGGACAGSWYTVGRVNYSLRDRRVTDSVLGFEYDAGCWIARMVAERLSTGSSEATTRLLLQLELVGLSRLGSNPLQVLKDNIPGYRMLRDERAPASPPPSP